MRLPPKSRVVRLAAILALLPVAPSESPSVSSMPITAIHRRLRAPFAALCCAALGLTAFAAAPAAAGSFTIAQCTTAAGQPIGITPGFITAFGMTPTDNCAAGGALQLAAPDNTISPFGSAWQAAGVQVAVPSTMPNTLLTNASARLSVSPKTGDTTLSYGHVVTFLPDGTNNYWGSEISIPAGDWPGLTNVAYDRGSAAGSRSFISAVQCYGPCNFQSTPTMTYAPVSFTLSESVAPTIATVNPVGLFDGAAQHGTRTVEFAASDADSGVQKVELRDGKGALIQTLVDGGDCTFTRPTPCPQTRAKVDAQVDTTKLPEGTQIPQLWIYDAAGNVLKQVLATITVDNLPDVAGPPAGTPNGTGGDPQSGHVVMKAGTTARTASMNAKVTMKGQVVDANGTAISGAAVAVFERVAVPGASEQQTTTLTTDASGRFTYAPKAGSSKEVRFAYASVSGSADFRASLTAKLTVRARVVFAISAARKRAGKRIVFSGKVVTDPAPPRDTHVVIEAKRGKGWINAATLRVRPGGTFRWAHTFHVHGTYTMRARVLSASDLPARPTASAQRRLRIF